MPGFDPRLFFFISICIAALCGFLCFAIRYDIPREIKGLNWWGNACIAIILAILFFVFSEPSNLLFSTFCVNISIVIAVVLMYCSIRQFYGCQSISGLYVGIPVVVATLMIWPTFIVDSYRLRIIIVSAANMALFLGCAHLIWSGNTKKFAEYFTLSLFCISGLAAAGRGLIAICAPAMTQPQDGSLSIEQLYLASFSLSLLALSLGFIWMVGKRLQIRLEEAALKDGLTGIATRSAFGEMAEKELAKGFRAQLESSVLMIDLDDFKAINDAFGHRGGDRALKDFVSRTNEVLRHHDLFGRYGGEEFVIFLPDTPKCVALQIAHRVLHAARERVDNNIPAFTVSIGLATGRWNADELGDFLHQADLALYRAKTAGKNRVESVETGELTSVIPMAIRAEHREKIISIQHAG